MTAPTLQTPEDIVSMITAAIKLASEGWREKHGEEFAPVLVFSDADAMGYRTLRATWKFGENLPTGGSVSIPPSIPPEMLRMIGAILSDIWHNAADPNRLGCERCEPGITKLLAQLHLNQ